MKRITAAAVALATALTMSACAGDDRSFDDAVTANASAATKLLDEAVATQKEMVKDEPWASRVQKVSMDGTGTKLYVFTDLDASKKAQDTGKEICRGYAPAVANFPDIATVLVADSSNTEIARCAIERTTSSSTGEVPSPTTP